MLKVFKYPISPADYFEIEMPENSQILRIDEQSDLPCLWALVNPSNPKKLYRFRMAGTGHPINENETLEFINTFFMAQGALVFHVFRVL